MDSNSIYINKCSCVKCGKEYTSKGIHPHYSINHIPGNKEKHAKRSRKNAKLRNIKWQEESRLKREKDKENYIPHNCLQCETIIEYENRNRKFCSYSCRAKYYNTRRNQSETTKQKISESVKSYRSENKIEYTPITFLQCHNCKRQFVHNTKKKETTSKHCSHICLQQTRSRNGRNNPNLGVKRSKDEIKLFNLITGQFINVEPNYNIIDGWDCDIALLDYKIAILWNGPWHYREMGFGNHSLVQVQNRDKIKTKLFSEMGWMVIIYEDRYYTPELAYLDLMNSIV